MTFAELMFLSTILCTNVAGRFAALGHRTAEVVFLMLAFFSALFVSAGLVR